MIALVTIRHLRPGALPTTSCPTSRRLPVAAVAVVGAEYCVTSCDLGVFVDEAAEPVPSENAHIRRGCGCIGTSGGRVLVQRPVRPVVVVVIDVLAEDQPGGAVRR